MIALRGYDNLKRYKILYFKKGPFMKKKMFCFLLFLITSIAFADPVVKEETTPPAPIGGITPDKIPPLLTGMKPITPPSAEVPKKSANNDATVNIQDEMTG